MFCEFDRFLKFLLFLSTGMYLNESWEDFWFWKRKLFGNFFYKDIAKKNLIWNFNSTISIAFIISKILFFIHLSSVQLSWFFQISLIVFKKLKYLLKFKIEEMTILNKIFSERFHLLKYIVLKKYFFSLVFRKHFFKFYIFLSQFSFIHKRLVF